MLTLSELQFAYTPGAVFTYPDLSVARGQAVLITGPSGCGKTTLLHLIAGLHAPRSGRMALDGRPLNPRRDVALVPQSAHLIGSLTVAQNIAAAAFATGIAFDAAFAQQLLDELGIAALAQRLPAQLSRGQAQRVAVARALSVKPAVLLADEPTANLDDASAAASTALLLRQASAHQAALLVASHDGRIAHLFTQLLALHAAPDITRQAA